MIFNVGAGGGASTADKVKYNNTESGLQSDNVQGAVDELNNSLTNNLIFIYEPPTQTGGQALYTFNVPENYEILAITPYCNNGGFYVHTSEISGNNITVRLASAGGTGTNVTVGIKVLVKNK